MRSPHIIMQEAVNFLTAKIYGDASQVFVPKCFEPLDLPSGTSHMDIEKFCALVIHPKTG